jgi:poly(A) polymerase
MSPPDPHSDPHARRAAAETIVRTLQDAGHVAYFAGGCVRDMLRNVDPNDYDVATDAPPTRVAQLFRHTRQVGEAFGVMLVHLERCDIEVATFRTEWGYTDGRRPDRIEFSDAEHDARRRDFTINGLFYDPIADTVHDFVNGRADLDRRVIRAIGDPDERFNEDYLRMLRAVRFAARLDFTVDPATQQAIAVHAAKLAGISRERIGMEVQLMLTDSSRAAAAAMVQQLHLDAPTLDEPHTDAPTRILAALSKRGQTPFRHYADSGDYPTALAAWALDRHLKSPADLAKLKGVQITRRWRAALVLSNEHSETLGGLVCTLPTVWQWRQLTVAKRKRLAARSDWPQLHQLAVALATVHTGLDISALDTDLHALTTDGIGIAPPPLITGDDLIAAGLVPGPAFKHILQTVYDDQLEGRLTTRNQAMQAAHRLHSQHPPD